LFYRSAYLICSAFGSTFTPDSIGDFVLNDIDTIQRSGMQPAPELIKLVIDGSNNGFNINSVAIQ